MPEENARHGAAIRENSCCLKTRGVPIRSPSAKNTPNNHSKSIWHLNCREIVRRSRCASGRIAWTILFDCESFHDRDYHCLYCLRAYLQFVHFYPSNMGLDCPEPQRQSILDGWIDGPFLRPFPFLSTQSCAIDAWKNRRYESFADSTEKGPKTCFFRLVCRTARLRRARPSVLRNEKGILHELPLISPGMESHLHRQTRNRNWHPVCNGLSAFSPTRLNQLNLLRIND